MNKLLLFGLLFISLLIILGGEGKAVCTTFNNNSVNASIISTTLCSGTYYNISVTFGNSNRYLVCEPNTWIIGVNGSTKIIQTGGNNNITVQGCNFINGYRFIDGGGYNHIVKDNYFGYSNNIQVAFTKGNMTITNNTFNNTLTAVTYAIYAEAFPNWRIENNTFYGNAYAIRMLGSNNVLINNNTFYRPNASAITPANNTLNLTISNNRVYGANRNGIDIGGYGTLAYNNYVEHAPHGALNIYAYNDTRVYNNTIINGSVYIQSANNMSFYNNRVDLGRSYMDTGIGKYLGIDNSGSGTINNNFYDNIINNSIDTCVHDGAKGSIYTNNTIFGCANSTIRVLNYYANISIVNDAQFINNTFTDGYAKFVRDNAGAFNITINENVQNLTADIPGATAGTGNIKMIYTGQKSIRIENGTLYTFNQALQYPFNDVKNTSNDAILASNVDNYSITLAANQQIEVGDFTYPLIEDVGTFVFNSSAMLVNWVTDVESNASVIFGLSPSVLNRSAFNSTYKLGGHWVLLDGLAPGVTYFFNVSSSRNGSDLVSMDGVYNFTMVDSPFAFISLPVDGSTWFNLVNVSVYGTAFNDSNSGRLFLDGVFYSSNGSMASNDPWFTNVSVAEIGSHSLVFEFCDAFSSCVNSSAVFFIRDTQLTVYTPLSGQDVFRFLNTSWSNSDASKNYIDFVNVSLVQGSSNYLLTTLVPEAVFNVSNTTLVNTQSAPSWVNLKNITTDNITVNKVVSNCYKSTSTGTMYMKVELLFVDGSSFNLSQQVCNGYKTFTNTNRSKLVRGVKTWVLWSYGGSTSGLGLIDANTTVYTETIPNSTVNGSSLTNYDLFTLNLSVGSSRIRVNEVGDDVSSAFSGYFDLMSNAYLNISALDYLGNSVQANISLFDNLTFITQSVIGNSGLFEIVKDRTYTITVTNSSYSVNTSQYVPSSFGTNYVNISLNPKNAINLSIYDIATGALITQNMSVTVTAGTVTSYWTTSGNVLLTNLFIGLNELKVSNANYSETRFSVVVQNNSYTQMSVYLSSGNLSENVTFTFYNVNGATIPNVLVGEYISLGGVPVLFQSDYSDINGRAYFSFDPSYSYTYYYSADGYLSGSFVLNPPRENNYDITIKFASAGTSYSPPSVAGSSSFNNISDILTFTYVSANESYTNYSYSVSKIVNANTVIICYDSNNLAYSSFNCDLSGYDGMIYVQGVVDDQVFYGAYIELGKSSMSDVVEPKDAALYSGIIIAVLVLGAIYLGGYATLVTLVAGLIFVLWIGWYNPLTLTLIIVVGIVSAFIAFGLRRY